MPKGSEELTNLRKNEIIDACETLYQVKSFKEITIKEIGNVTSFTRTSIYNYFQTKEEIFLGLLQREYQKWNDELLSELNDKEMILRKELALIFAKTLAKRELMLKILSMNLYEIEDNCRIEKLIEFKQEYGRSLNVIAKSIKCCVPSISHDEAIKFVYTFFPFVYGIYPYTHASDKQLAAMKEAKIEFHEFTIYDLTLNAALKLLEVKDDQE